MRFSLRLILFLAATLLAIQTATILTARAMLRGTLMEDGRNQVAASETRFVRQLDELEHQLAEGVRLLTLDFALRQAIADRDTATVVSALRNHGRRVGASRMLLIAPYGTIDGDTGTTSDDSPRRFPDPALLDTAATQDHAGSVAVLGGKPVWLVAVPVMAPDLIAFVAAALPLDDAELIRLREAAGVSGKIGIAAAGPGGWTVLAGTVDASVLRQLPEPGTTVAIDGGAGGEALAATHAMKTLTGAPPIRVVLDYPLSEALRRYERLSLVLLPILLLGLTATLAGVALISRGVARPLEALARQTQRIAAGDYTPPPRLHRADELGQLSAALGAMTRAIAEREDNIRHQATHDPITGLPNRAAVAASIESHAGSAAPLAVLVIGLIRWPDIAATVGRDIGERLLCDSAARLAGLGPDGALTGGIGENTFAMLLTDTGIVAAMNTAARIAEAFDTPWHESELTIDNPVAIGIAMLPDHGTVAAQLLRRAEVALAAAAAAETRVAVYRPETDPHRPERLSLMSDLRAGLTRGEFHLLYQPKLDLRQWRIAGAEALVRWNHPVRGRIFPDDFISLAEETGNIQHLTRWALRAGLAEAKGWRDRGLMARVAINLSVRDLADPALPGRIAALRREFGLPMRAVILEVTESAIMGEPDTAIAVLRALDAEGTDLAIDDFGVGQSSLAYLRRLPVREIKLDKTFILNLQHNPDDRTIVRSVIELGHGLGYLVTAEGVEDEESLRILEDFGCDHAQGYFIGKPMPPEEFERFANTWPARQRDAPC